MRQKPMDVQPLRQTLFSQRPQKPGIPFSALDTVDLRLHKDKPSEPHLRFGGYLQPVLHFFWGPREPKKREPVPELPPNASMAELKHWIQHMRTLKVPVPEKLQSLRPYCLADDSRVALSAFRLVHELVQGDAKQRAQFLENILLFRSLATLPQAVCQFLADSYIPALPQTAQQLPFWLSLGASRDRELQLKLLEQANRFQEPEHRLALQAVVRQQLEESLKA